MCPGPPVHGLDSRWALGELAEALSSILLQHLDRDHGLAVVPGVADGLEGDQRRALAVVVADVGAVWGVA